jgi:hypothetical protein
MAATTKFKPPQKTAKKAKTSEKSLDETLLKKFWSGARRFSTRTPGANLNGA